MAAAHFKLLTKCEIMKLQHHRNYCEMKNDENHDEKMEKILLRTKRK